MYFKKPENVRYVDMCIYIDSIERRGNPTEKELSTIYEYLYHLSKMLAYQHKYFKKTEYYEDFGLYMANQVLIRLFFNPKLKEKNEDGTPVLKPIKSILNYLKSILYGRKIIFEQQEYSQKIEKKHDELPVLSDYSFSNQIRCSLEEQNRINIELYFDSITRTIKHYLKTQCVYRNDKQLLKYIYISCMLTILNCITFTEEDKYRLKNLYSTPEAKFINLCKIYKENRDGALILYHLDSDMKDYITVLVRRMSALIREDIKELSHDISYVSDDVLADITFLELDEIGQTRT